MAQALGEVQVLALMQALMLVLVKQSAQAQRQAPLGSAREPELSRLDEEAVQSAAPLRPEIPLPTLSLAACR
jgi:hypothetical protein